MATTKIINDLIDLNQTGNTTALKGCVGTNAQQPTTPTISVEYLVVGGGGGGGGFGQAGGGGAGGLSTATIGVPNNTDLSIVVGQGGAGGTGALPATGANGQDSGFYQIQGQGGGGSQGHEGGGLPGGSGGGSATLSTGSNTGGAGVSGQGNAGGTAVVANYGAPHSGSGGGGAGAPGTGGNNFDGDGGSGSDAVALGIITQANAATAGVGETNGAERNFAGGGGGGAYGVTCGDGGDGGGGDGNVGGGTHPVANNGYPGTINTGGGGGGVGSYGPDTNIGGSGGSGVVILKYANADVGSITIGGSLIGGLSTATETDNAYPIANTAFYTLNGNSTDTSSTGSYNGVDGSSISYASGYLNQGAVFTQVTTSKIVTPSPIPTTTDNDFSISIWFKYNSDFTTGYISLCGGSGWVSGAYPTIYLLLRSTGISGEYTINGARGFGGTFYYGPPGSACPLMHSGEWYNLASVYTSSNKTFTHYLNGSVLPIPQALISSASGSIVTNFCYGQYEDSGSYSAYAWDGMMDQIRVFNNTALSASQVLLLYQDTFKTKFDDSTNTTLVFKGGSGTINLIGSSVLGPKVGDLRTNTDQTSTNYAASAMEHYMSTGWRVFDNSTLATCNYPTTATALYQLNSDGGTTNNVPDTCGTYDGTATSITYTTGSGGEFGEAAIFNGSTSKIVVPSAISISTDATDFNRSMWIYTDAAFTSFRGIIGTNDSYYNAPSELYISNVSGNTYNATFVRRYGGTYYGFANTSNFTLLPTTFYHLSLNYRYSPQSIDLYINESLVSTTTTIAFTGSQSVYAYECLGQYNGNGSYSSYAWDGRIDQVRFFNSALTSAQVTLLYNEQ